MSDVHIIVELHLWGGGGGGSGLHVHSVKIGLSGIGLLDDGGLRGDWMASLLEHRGLPELLSVLDQ